jgi:hypothetical protein
MGKDNILTLEEIALALRDRKLQVVKETTGVCLPILYELREGKQKPYSKTVLYAVSRYLD